MATHETGAFIHVYDGSGMLIVWVVCEHICMFIDVVLADSTAGNLYVSDSSGSKFGLSLSNHLVGYLQTHQPPSLRINTHTHTHTPTHLSPHAHAHAHIQFKVQEYPLGHYSVHDFYEVKSMRGVYITTTVLKGKTVTG